MRYTSERVERRQAPDWIEKRQALRIQAETMLSGVVPAASAVQPTEVLMRELLVHKVQLEIQVEELRRAHIEMEEARDRYADLYDFSPMGYLTIDRDGLINEINLTGATLLGAERSKLVNRHFSKFVAASDKERCSSLFMGIMEHYENRKHAFDLEVTRADESTFLARIECERKTAIDTEPLLRVALLDMSKFTPAAPQG